MVSLMQFVMKLKGIITIAAVTLTLVGCFPHRYEEETIRGVLYSDSTLTTPIVDAELYFWELNYEQYPNYRTEGTYLGCAKTDSEGKWGFSYVKYFDNPYMTGRKFKIVYPDWGIEYDGRLIYVDEENRSSPIVVYPGCWKSHYDIDTVSSTTGTTASKGGAK